MQVNSTLATLIDTVTRHLVFLCGLLLIQISGAYAQSELSKETKLKAAYLFNFTKYIEWPSEAFSDKVQAVNICIHENLEMVDFMRALVDKRKVGKNQRLVKIWDFRDVKSCHLSFIQEERDAPHPKIDASLVVADLDFENGLSPAMRFYQQNGKLRFEIFMDEMEKQHVTVSSELLKLARIK